MRNLLLKTTLILLISFNVSFAAEKCPVVSTSKVAEIFKSNSVNIVSADSSGTCFWHVTDKGDSLMTNVIKQPSVKQAVELFKTHEKTIFTKFTDHISRPKIGDKAFIGMKKEIETLPSGEKVNQIHINLVVLKDDTIYTFFYDVNEKSNINKNTVLSVEKIGHASLSNDNNIKQSFAKCGWFLPEELDQLLGKKGQVIQSLGDERCIVYTKPGSAILTAMGDTMEKSTFNLMKNINKETCKVQELPQFNNTAYAYYDCPAPAKGVINVELLKSGHHMAVTYQPDGRRANIKDIDRMENLLKYITKKL